MRVAHEARVITPEPLFLCRDMDVLGREFFVMRRVPGVAQGHRLTREAALIPDADALARTLGSNLARIHAIRPPFRELESPSFSPTAGIERPPADPALAAIAQLRSHLDALDDSHPALEWGLRWCERHAPATRAITLIHGDYRTGNYLVDEGRLAGVLDWEFARWGDPRQDLGWFTARCWRFSRSDLEGGGIAALEPFLAGYESVAGHRISRDDLDYWQAMAHLRWAVIALQQARRHARGGERSLELALTGRIVPELEHEALRLIAGAAWMTDISDAADLTETARDALLRDLLPSLPARTPLHRTDDRERDGHRRARASAGRRRRFAAKPSDFSGCSPKWVACRVQPKARTRRDALPSLRKAVCARFAPATSTNPDTPMRWRQRLR